MIRSGMLFATTLGVSVALGISGAQAGEITGNGKEIEINARSECAFSGINDTPEGGGMDPGGKIQSYGYLVSHYALNPQDWDPNGAPFQRIPGFACNPNRWSDLHDDE
ncbi:MAG TPA: hypothetical protein VFO36_07080 [Nitrospiraceae bacterium]|nr:hypothetical protein [Nitrospiraceae bacterium]